MKTFAFALLAVGAVLAALPASAQETGQTTFNLIAKNPDYVWTNEAGAVNPELVVPAGAEITVNIRNDETGGFHSFAVTGEGQSPDITDPAATATLVFQAPESGSVEYNCPYHPTTMTGTIRVAGSPATNGGDGDGGSDGGNDTPGVALVGTLAALAVVALYARRR